MSWKDKSGKKLEAGDTVIMEGAISGRHSGDRISVTVAPGQTVLVDAAICRKGKARPEAEAKVEPEPETRVLEGPEPEAVSRAKPRATGEEDAPL